MDQIPSDPRSRPLVSLGLFVAVVGLPLVGAAFVGRELREFFRFPPPLAIPSNYLPFSWVAAGAVIASLGVLAVSWMVGARPVPARNPPRVADAAQVNVRRRRLPMWGWFALAWTVLWWVLAWNRWPRFEPLQRYTFFPLWIGFIVTVNALTERRGYRSLLRRAPRIWGTLFAASAVFWWLFEWLNRFVQNWHYLADGFGAWGYAVHATLCFSTVLPAVAAVAEWLGTYGKWLKHTTAGPSWSWFATRRTGALFCGVGLSTLVLTGAYPQIFYPALWVSPLLLVLGESILSGRSGLAREISRGDWRRAATWMLAALVCGFFWELWNWHSLAKWIYTVPGVERWHVFEMPLLGYAGYLPFGLECLLVIDQLAPRFTVACGPGFSR